jgi:glycosyltransferase involved in cell wall biosynthesis
VGTSILILTLNEEQNLPACLESVKWSDDIVVLDSFSSDRTIEIAKSAGARVFQRKFDNWSAHQNWAVQEIPFKHSWVFYIDADERMPPALRSEIEGIAGDPSNTKVAYYCGRKNFFMGRWIKHSYPPSPILRFFRPAHVRFERLVNPTPVIDGQHGYLREQFFHCNFSKGLTEWIDKHNKYSELEALDGLRQLRECPVRMSALFSTDAATRRKALKNLAFRLPFRPTLRFMYMYFLRLGFLDGWPGLTYCRLLSMYEYMIVLKMKELRLREKGQSL